MAQNAWKWHVYLYVALQDFFPGQRLVEIADLEEIVATSQMVKMKIAVTKMRPDDAPEGEILTLVGNSLAEDFIYYGVFSMETFPFNWTEAEGEPEEYHWAEMEREYLATMLRCPFKFIHFENYPNEAWIPVSTYALQVVKEGQSTTIEGGKRVVEVDFKEVEPKPIALPLT